MNQITRILFRKRLGGFELNSKIFKQFFGTISSIILGIATLANFKNIEKLDLFNDIGNLFNIWALTAFLIMILAMITMVRTGMSFISSKNEYIGMTYFLNLYLAYFHYLSVVALAILFSFVLFGAYWWIGFSIISTIFIVLYYRTYLRTSIIVKS